MRGWSATVGANQSKIVDLLITNLANLLAVASTVMLFVAGSAVTQVVGGVLVVLALVIVGWLLRRQAGRPGGLLTSYAGARLVLLVAMAAACLSRSSNQIGWIWVATGLALFAVLLEPTVKVLLSKTEQVAVNLPGVRPVPAPPFAPDLLVVVSVGVVAIGVVLAVVRAPGWSLVVPVLVQGVAVVLMMLYAARANVVAKRALAAVPRALAAHRPAFAVYYGGLQGARYQLGMWLPYLERLDKPFVVITREAETVPTITALTQAPVVVPRTTSALGDLDRLVPPSMKAAFYVQGSRANLSFQRFRRLTHVWLNHGDSDKAANFSPRHATYDKVLVCGQQGVERYAAHGVRIPAERLVKVGRPQVERIEVRDAPLPAGGPRTVFYAPTWRGGRPATDYSSLPLGDRIVESLLERGATVIFRPHPLSHADPTDAGLVHRIQQRLADDLHRSGRPHLWGAAAEVDRDIADCINACDALVTDVSSVASDHLASGKPFAMVAVRAGGEAFRQECPMARVAYVIEKDLSTLEEALDQLLGGDPLAEQRRAYRTHCLGEWLGPRAAEEFLRVAGKIVTGAYRQRRPGAVSPRAAAQEPLEDVLFAGDPDGAELVEDETALVEDEAARLARLEERRGQVT